jgi:hypothetical protein
MACTGKWKRLAEAIGYVAATTRCATEEAKAKICRAIGEGSIKVLAKLGRHTTKGLVSAETVEQPHLQLPARLNPQDLDWEQSQPLKPWLVSRLRHGLHGYWAPRKIVPSPELCESDA